MPAKAFILSLPLLRQWIQKTQNTSLLPTFRSSAADKPVCFTGFVFTIIVWASYEFKVYVSIDLNYIFQPLEFKPSIGDCF